MSAETPIIEQTSPADKETIESTARESREDQANSSLNFVWIRVQIFFWLFLLYCLSLGPMYWTWYQSKYIGGSPWVAVFYEPLLRLTAIPVFRDWINWYLSFWG